jgi:3-(3-hydroxy-phenyl)propionate hydroxylase
MSHGPDERHYPMANIQQNLLERLLIRAADASELIDLRWLSPVVAVDPRQDGVRLGVETPEGAYDIEAEYVVAADGARSAVRQLMGLRLSGETHAARYLIADIRLQSASPTERRAWFDSPVNRGSTVLMHRQPRDIWRVDYQLRDEDDPDVELDPDRVRERIRAVLAMAGETGDWEIDWISLYRAHSLCLDDYVHGRVCFAGDAAHLVPIFGVKGLNSGFADADNLAWKLAAIVEGRAGPGLLASYGQERRAATLDIFREAGKSTRFMTPPTRGYQLMRQGVLSLALTESWAGALADPRQSTPFRYADSPLNGWAVAEAAFTAGPAAGASAVSVRLDEGFLHDLFDTRPVALCVTAGNGDRNALEAAAAMVDRPGGLNLLVAGEGPLPPGARRIADRAGAVARAYGAGPGSIYLLRPDWHVAARSKDGVTVKELEAALDRMWGYDVRD